MPSTPPLDTPISRSALALLAGAAAAASFVSMDAVIKLISPRYGALQLSFFRFASGSLYAVLLWLWHRSPAPERRWWPMHALRSIFLLISLVGYFHALTVLPLAQTVAISYLAPIALAGMFATVGLLSLTWAFTHLEASRVAPLEYTSFVWASALGYALFGELPSLNTGLSALCIVGGCLLLLRR